MKYLARTHYKKEKNLASAWNTKILHRSYQSCWYTPPIKRVCSWTCFWMRAAKLNVLFWEPRWVFMRIPRHQGWESLGSRADKIIPKAIGLRIPRQSRILWRYRLNSCFLFLFLLHGKLHYMLQPLHVTLHYFSINRFGLDLKEDCLRKTDFRFFPFFPFMSVENN